MTAIAGTVGFHEDFRADRARHTRMGTALAARLAHRSPHAELRIHTLAAGAFVGDEVTVGRVVAAVDGEIFNLAELAARYGHPDMTPSQVVAAGFAQIGEGVFAELDGPFAACVWADDALVLARDPLGERPLYHTTLGGAFTFASEIKALVACEGIPAATNPASLLKLLTFSFIPGAESMFAGIFELLPGHVARVTSLERVETRPFWALREAPNDEPEEVLVERLRTTLRAAVDKRLGARKRVAAFLSGGIDSSAVVALLAERGVDVTALSVGFGTTQLNELPFARTVAEHCHVTHDVMHVEPHDFIDQLPRIIWQLDDPLCDCITVPNYLLAARAHDLVGGDVVFNGEGGDPLFGGPKNKFMILGEWYAFLGGYDRAKAYLGSYHKMYDHLDAFCTPELQEAAGGTEMLEAVVRPYLEDTTHGHFLNRLMHANIRLKGGQNILVKVDKMLSAHGLHAASPLFDKALTELSFSVPTSMKRRGDVEKWILKKAVEPLLPHNIVYRKKMGMGVPLNHWFKRTKLREYALDLLLSSRAKARGFFQPETVESLFSARGLRHRVGKDRMGELAWMLVAIELWHRVYLEAKEAP